MTQFDAEPQSEREQPPAALLARLLSTDWRERQEALAEVQERNPPGLARALLEMIRQNQGNLHAFIAAVQALERVGRPLTADLVDLLYGPDLELRVAVPLVLSSLDGPDVVPALVRAAADPSQPENVRFNATEALGHLRPPEALEPLLTILKEGPPFLRYGAVVALGQLGMLEAEPHLLPLLRDETLAEPTIDALAQMGSARAVEGITNWMGVHPGYAPDAVAALAAIEARSMDAEVVRNAFMRAAGEDGQRRVLELSLPGVLDIAPSDPCWSALAVVTAWIAEQGLLRKDARSALARLLADPGARATAEGALLRLPGPAPLELVEALNSQDPDHVLSAAKVLAASGDPQVLPALAALLRRDDETLAGLGAEGLGNIGGPLALSSLTAALAYPKSYVRRVAVKALVRLNAPGLSAQAAALLGHSDPGVREAALRLLAQIDPPAASRAALAACRDTASEVRRAGIEIAARGDGSREQLQRAVELLGAAFSDPDAGTRRAAIQAAASLPEQAGLPLLTQALGNKDGWVRVHAARGLGQLSSIQTLEALSGALQDPFPPVRSAAIQALLLHGGQDLPADLREKIQNQLRSALSDSSPEVRQAAANAFENGGWGEKR